MLWRGVVATKIVYGPAVRLATRSQPNAVGRKTSAQICHTIALNGFILMLPFNSSNQRLLGTHSETSREMKRAREAGAPLCEVLPSQGL